ncbi:MAG: hypothetical protein HYR60_29910, partial [Acidobacteria bacterium]|nr:hypothetical protein [Acidobacteriota bacterium]
KNEPRIRDLLLRGTLVSGASRFRWKGLDADPAAIRDLLGAFPDPDPGLKFAPERCIRAVLRGPSRQIDLPREAAIKKPFLRKSSFWDVLMEVVAASQMSYLDYSYREHADRYSMPVSSSALLRLRDNAKLLRYTTLRDQILSAHVETVELYTQR